MVQPCCDDLKCNNAKIEKILFLLFLPFICMSLPVVTWLHSIDSKPSSITWISIRHGTWDCRAWYGTIPLISVGNLLITWTITRPLKVSSRFGKYFRLIGGRKTRSKNFQDDDNCLRRCSLASFDPEGRQDSNEHLLPFDCLKLPQLQGHLDQMQLVEWEALKKSFKNNYKESILWSLTGRGKAAPGNAGLKGSSGGRREGGRIGGGIPPMTPDNRKGISKKATLTGHTYWLMVGDCIKEDCSFLWWIEV